MAKKHTVHATAGIETLNHDEIDHILDRLCATGTTTALTMLATLRAASKEWRHLVDTRVSSTLGGAPRRTVLTTMDKTAGTLSDILKCHHAFGSADLCHIPEYKDLDDVDDNEWDAIYDSNKRGSIQVAETLVRELTGAECAPKLVEDAVLIHVASQTTDAEQLYQILGNYFGCVDPDDGDKDMDMASAARIGELLVLSSKPSMLQHVVGSMDELNEDIEDNLANQRVSIAYLEENGHPEAAAIRKESLAATEARRQGGTLQLALLESWWHHFTRAASARFVLLQPTVGTNQISCTALLGAVVSAIEMQLPDEDDEDQAEPPTAPGTPAQYATVRKIVKNVMQIVYHRAPVNEQQEVAMNAAIGLANDIHATLTRLGVAAPRLRLR